MSQLSAPAYRKHAPTGRAVVTLNDVQTGERREIPLGKHGTKESKRLYDETISRWLANGRRLDPKQAESEGISNNSLILQFLKENASRYETRGKKEASEVYNFKQAAKQVRLLYGTEPARVFSPKRLKNVRSSMVKLGWSRKFVNAQINRIRRVYRWAVSEELIPGEVLHSLKSLSPLRPGEENVRESPRIKPVDEELVRSCLPYMQKPIAALVELLLWTGARAGEIVLLRPCDIDRTSSVWVFRPHYHKTEKHGHERTILLGPAGQQVLSPWLVGCSPEEYVFSPAKAETQRLAERAAQRKTPRWASHVQRNQKKRVGNRRKRKPGDRYDVDAFRRAITYGIDKADRLARKERDAQLIAAGKLPKDHRTPNRVRREDRLVPPWHPHQLRHTAATRLRKQHGIETVRVILGHSSIEVSELYAETDMEQGKRVMEASG